MIGVSMVEWRRMVHIKSRAFSGGIDRGEEGGEGNHSSSQNCAPMTMKQARRALLGQENFLSD